MKISQLVKRTGSSLVVVMGSMVVISAIVIIIFSVWSSSARQTAIQGQKLHAYYIAKSGADVVAAYIVDYKSDFLAKWKSTLLTTPNGGLLKDFSVTKNIGDGSFTAVVKKGVDELIVESTGEHLGNTQVVRLSLTDTAQIQSANYVFHRALYTKTALNLTNFTDILNNITASNLTITPKSGYTYNGTNEPNSTLIYLSPTLPSYTVNTTQILTTTNDADAINRLNLTSDITYIHGITIPVNTLLTINPNGADRIVVVNDISVTGSIVQSGVGGSVRFFILNSANFNSGYVDSSKPLLILGASSLSALSINTSSDFNAFIYAPDTTVQLTHSLGKFRGSIIANTVNGGLGLNGTGTVDYKALINQGVMSQHFRISNDPNYIRGKYLKVGW